MSTPDRKPDEEVCECGAKKGEPHNVLIRSIPRGESP